MSIYARELGGFEADCGDQTGPVAATSAIDPDDIVRAKSALSELGLFQGPVRPFTDDALFDGIKTFQRQNGRRPDGVMQPGGPTARLMDSALFERANGTGDGPPLRVSSTVGRDAANDRGGRYDRPKDNGRVTGGRMSLIRVTDPRLRANRLHFTAPLTFDYYFIFLEIWK